MTSKGKLVIFEGPDRVGKSTLSNWFAATLDTKVTHFSTPDPHLKKLDPQYQYRNLPKPQDTNGHLVLDRSWISGLFYEVTRRKSVPNWQSVLDLESHLKSMGWSIEYIYVDRLWSTSLLLEHITEVTQGEGYGTLADRMYEHHLWPTFIKSLAATNKLSPIYVLENHDQLACTFQDLTYRNLTEARFWSISSYSKSSAATSTLSSIWAKQPWSNPTTI